METRDFCIGFLIGMIEGEGCIAKISHTIKGKTYVYPQIVIENTDKQLLEKCITCLASLDITVHLYYNKHKENHPNWKNSWRLVILGKKNMNKVVSFYSYKSQKFEKLIELNKYS
ncbi:MAG: LAGLIDADG family homing endonuclease [Candidatus Aenigmarchaeota archaeon]|nr:LAGLIDADG family homing endonuclease [Candidatus Aenigmarchaeota archaeon]